MGLERAAACADGDMVVEIWTDADFDMAYSQLMTKHGLDISVSENKAQMNTKSILGTGDHTESIQDVDNTYPSECRSRQSHGNGNSLSVPEPTHNLGNPEITRNKPDSHSKRVQIDPDGATDIYWS